MADWISTAIQAGGAALGSGFSAYGNRVARKEREKANSYNDPNSQNSNALLKQLLEGGSQGIQNTPLDFSKIRDSTMARYNSEVVPSLAQRFTSDLGQGQSSSGFLGTMFGGQADLQQQLAGQEQIFNMDKYKLLLDQLQLGLGSRQMDTSQNWQQNLGTALTNLAPGAAQLAQSYGQQQPQMSNTQRALGNYSPKQQSDIIRNISGKYQLGPQA